LCHLRRAIEVHIGDGDDRPGARQTRGTTIDVAAEPVALVTRFSCPQNGHFISPMGRYFMHMLLRLSA
jgi:hypothetical protein